ncbi:GAF domain-containing protein, partial [Bacillus cereus]|uniref:GAF domain-containing protein n=1 Tax=Bacillus cereus TaxID=1396 RepID=UPI0034D97C13
LGPFQGLPACVRNPFRRDAIRVATETKTTQLVAGKQQFPRHIHYYTATNTEIIVQLVKAKAVIGVLYIDSLEKNRFDAVD